MEHGQQDGQGHGQQDGQQVEPGARSGRAAGGDPLVEARIALEGVGDLPLEERGEVFERVHATVVEELRQLELG